MMGTSSLAKSKKYIVEMMINQYRDDASDDIIDSRKKKIFNGRIRTTANSFAKNLKFRKQVMKEQSVLRRR